MSEPMSKKSLFTPPAQTGRTIVITGTGGLGYQAGAALARAGANVILAGRNEKSGAEAAARLNSTAPHAPVTFEKLDLADLRSIEAFAHRLLTRGEGIDVLLNNAGVMSPPHRTSTAQGHELQVGVNYLGHFALTAWLMPLLRIRPGGRVVNVTSLAQHHAKPIDLAELDAQRSYSPGLQYCLSKLFQAMFTVELQRRSDANGWGITSLAAHPGFAGTNLFETGGRLGRIISTRIVLPLLGQSALDGAAPLLFAATAPDALPGKLYGPGGFLEMKGAPRERKFSDHVFELDTAKRLWDLSEALTDQRFEGK